MVRVVVQMRAKPVFDHDIVSWVVDEALGKHGYPETKRSRLVPQSAKKVLSGSIRSLVTRSSFGK